MHERVYYVDWLRVLAVLLLFPFHTWRVFNEGETFYVKAAYRSDVLNYALGFIDVWHMPLLFALAGASTYLAMRKRTVGQYAGERLKRLGVPLLFGALVIIPPQTWSGARFNSGYRESFVHYVLSGDFLAWNIQGGTDYYGGFGLGHLWFILYLLLIALLFLPLLAWWRSERGARSLARFARSLAHPAGPLLAAFVLLIGEALPSPIDGKPFFTFMALFVLGYAVLSEDAFVSFAQRFRWPALLLGVASAVFWINTGSLRESFPDPSWQRAVLSYVWALGLWMAIAGLVGFGKQMLDRRSRTLSYLAEASYPLYILHQTVIVLIGLALYRIVGLEWPVVLALSVAATFALYEAVRRVNVLRFCFGMKPRSRKAIPEATLG